MSKPAKKDTNVKAVRGLYSTEDVAFLRDAFLAQSRLSRDKTGLVHSVKQNPPFPDILEPFHNLQGYYTYILTNITDAVQGSAKAVIAAESKEGETESLKNSLLNIKTSRKPTQIIIPVLTGASPKNPNHGHWIFFQLKVNDNKVEFSIHNSMGTHDSNNVEAGQKIQEFVEEQGFEFEFVPSHAPAIQKGNVYCGGYAARGCIGVLNPTHVSPEENDIWRGCENLENDDSLMRLADATLVSRFGNDVAKRDFGSNKRGNERLLQDVAERVLAKKKVIGSVVYNGLGQVKWSDALRKKLDSIEEFQNILRIIDQASETGLYIGKITNHNQIRNLIIACHEKLNYQACDNNPFAIFFNNPSEYMPGGSVFSSDMVTLDAADQADLNDLITTDLLQIIANKFDFSKYPPLDKEKKAGSVSSNDDAQSKKKNDGLLKQINKTHELAKQIAFLLKNLEGDLAAKVIESIDDLNFNDDWGVLNGVVISFGADKDTANGKNISQISKLLKDETLEEIEKQGLQFILIDRIKSEFDKLKQFQDRDLNSINTQLSEIETVYGVTLAVDEEVLQGGKKKRFLKVAYDQSNLTNGDDLAFISEFSDVLSKKTYDISVINDGVRFRKDAINLQEIEEAAKSALKQVKAANVKKTENYTNVALYDANFQEAQKNNLALQKSPPIAVSGYLSLHENAKISAEIGQKLEDHKTSLHSSLEKTQKSKNLENFYQPKDDYPGIGVEFEIMYKDGHYLFEVVALFEGCPADIADIETGDVFSFKAEQNVDEMHKILQNIRLNGLDKVPRVIPTPETKVTCKHTAVIDSKGRLSTFGIEKILGSNVVDDPKITRKPPKTTVQKATGSKGAGPRDEGGKGGSSEIYL